MRASIGAPAGLLGLVLASWPALGLCQSLSDADAFVHRLYRAYQHGGGPDYLGPQAPRVFSPRLLGLIRRDQRLTPAGDVPSLDGDPICDCQDSGGMTGVHVDVSAAAPGHAVAKVRFRLDAERRALTLDLVAVHGRWLVDDVHSRDTPSLAAFLLDAHPHRRKAARAG